MGPAATVKLLVDTSVFLWTVYKSEKLSLRVHGLLSSTEAEVYLSSVSVWEIANKVSAGSLTLTQPVNQVIPRLREEYGFQPLPFTDDDALLVGILPSHHRDPFDRMLICQAIANNCSIVTPDEAIRQYPVHTIW